MEKILLHACCAPCASYPLLKLKQDNRQAVVFFYNPNIYPLKEYDIRRIELEKYCKKLGVEYLEGDYDTENYYSAVNGLEKEPEKGLRCDKCFYLRLLKTAQKARELNINSFTTTLSVSPHKNSKKIFEIGDMIAQQTGVEFLKYDFKKQDGFKISRQIAKENNMYFQTYCGCEFSIRNQFNKNTLTFKLFSNF